MIFELAIVEDRGTHYLVTGVTKSSFDGLANREDKVLKLSYNSYQKCSDGLAEGKTVTINKELTTDEVLPGDVNVSDEAISELETYKKVAMQKINKKMTYNTATISALEILSFTVINSELASLGYFITEKNREDKYIEIIEAEDEELIEKLEEYLILLDLVQNSLKFSNMCKKYNNQILLAEDQNAVDDILSNFYKEYDAYSS